MNFMCVCVMLKSLVASWPGIAAVVPFWPGLAKNCGSSAMKYCGTFREAAVPLLRHFTYSQRPYTYPPLHPQWQGQVYCAGGCYNVKEDAIMRMCVSTRLRRGANFICCRTSTYFE